LGQLVLDPFLPGQQPVQGLVHLVDIGVGDAQFVGQRALLPQPRGRQLGTRVQDSLNNQGHDQLALATRTAADQPRQFQLADHLEHRLDVPVRQRTRDA